MSAAQVTTSNLSVLPMTPRRIVTGHESGRSVLKTDGLLEPQDLLQGTVRITRVWTTDSTPATDNNDDTDGAARPIPGLGLVIPNGTNHQFTDIAPGATVPMHRTNSVDTNILISGSLEMILDGDARTEIKPGDAVVQRGTLHAWHNPSSTEWARLFTILVHADPVRVNDQELEETWKP